MVVKREVSNDPQPGEASKAKPAGAKPDRVDPRDARSLAASGSTASERKQVRQSKIAEVAAAAVSSGKKPAVAPQPPEVEETIRSESARNLSNINDEIEEVLVELERLKSKVVPITERKDSRPEYLPHIAANLEKSAAASAPQSNIAGAGSPIVHNVKEQARSKPAISQIRPASDRSVRRWKIRHYAIAAAIVAGIVGGFLFFRFGGITSFTLTGQAISAEAKELYSSIAGKVALWSKPKNLPRASKEGEAKTSQTASSASVSTEPPGAVSRSMASSEPSSGQSVSEPSPESPGARPEQATGRFSEARPDIEEQPSRPGSAPGAGAISPSPASPPIPAIPVPESASAAPAPRMPGQSSLKIAQPEFPGSTNAKSETEPPKKAAVPVGTPVAAESIVRVRAVYPVEAKLQGIEGVVELEADINEIGDVVRAKAVSGPELLRSAAEEALMKWKFKPASVNGVDINSQARISIVFNIR